MGWPVAQLVPGAARLDPMLLGFWMIIGFLDSAEYLCNSRVPSVSVCIIMIRMCCEMKTFSNMCIFLWLLQCLSIFVLSTKSCLVGVLL